jgi:DNA modification methylase
VARAEQVMKKDPELWEKAKAGEVTINAAYTKVKAAEKLEALKEAKIEATKEATTKMRPSIVKMDCIDFLNSSDMADLILTDPPYMTDVDDIKSFSRMWLPTALSKLKDTGRAFICIGAYPEEIHAYLSVAMPKQILVWTYRNTLGPSPKLGYKLNWQAILYYEMPNAKAIQCPIMMEQFSVQDINAPDGRVGDRHHAWQKPMELAERFIRHSTSEGDLILDPFACTGTFLLAASKLGRIGRGCDISQENIDIAKERGCEQLD